MGLGLGSCSGKYWWFTIDVRLVANTLRQLREISYLGENTVAMVYDDFPIIDYFRYVSDDLVAGAMDSKKMKAHGTYYFYLKRIS